jgi:hypothetical protein
MVAYRSIKKPATLKALPVAEDDQVIFATGVHAAIGTDLPAGETACQLDIYYGTNKTFVRPVGGPAELKPWTLSGFVSPQDCRTHYHANPNPLQG